jgi:hypothetical protein
MESGPVNFASPRKTSTRMAVFDHPPIVRIVRE